MMRKNPFLTALAFTVVATGTLAAQMQTPQAHPPHPAKPPAQTPPATQPPAPGTTYKPEFEIPKPEGTPSQPKTDPATGAPAEGYVIGPQDNLSIIVTDETDLTGKYRVDTDGTISMPYLSRVPLAGLSLAEAQDKLTAMLKAGFIRNPQVRIEVDQFKARSVMVMGEVRTPGKVTLPGTSMSLLEALAMAGSPTQNASNEVLVMHPPKPGDSKAPEPITLNRKDLELGKVGRDITLQDGDIVNIPVAKRFYISGFVKNPGSLVLDPGTTVGQAIILAGGLSDRGSDRRIRILRIKDGKTVDIPANLEDKVMPNDEIKIRSRFF
jgi:polysaccharide export outer membrane protein